MTFEKFFKACTFEFYEDKDWGTYYVQAYFSNSEKLRSWCHLRSVPRSIYLDKNKAKEVVANSFYWSLLSKGEIEYDS